MKYIHTILKVTASQDTDESAKADIKSDAEEKDMGELLEDNEITKRVRRKRVSKDS